MTARLPLLRTSLVLLAGAAWSQPAGAQYYYNPAYGPPPPAYAPPPYGGYNAPPPPGREYGRGYDYDYPPPRQPRPLSARTVVDRLEQMGYDDVSQPRFTGTLYIVQATGPGGVRQQVVVDAIRGIVLNRTAVAPGYEEPRRYGGRGLDTDDLRERPSVTPRRAQPRREARRPETIDSGEPPGPDAPPSATETPPPPADPRLAPSAEPAPRAAPRPLEGRSGGRQAGRSEGGGEAHPKETGSRPFGVNPVPSPPKPTEGEQRKATQPAPAKKQPPVAAVERPAPEKPVRVIQGVTPHAPQGESRSQLDNLPPAPEAPAPTGN